MRKLVGRIVDFSGNHPLVVLLITFLILVGTWWYAAPLFLHPHTDIRELLPKDNPGFKAFEHQLGRVGGGATLIVIAESPDRDANQRYIDDVAARLETQMATEKKACLAKRKPEPVRPLTGTGAAAPVRAVAFSPDGKTLASAGDDNVVHLFAVESGAELRRFEGHAGGVRAVAFSPDGKLVASGSKDKTVRVFDVATGKEVAKLEGHDDAVLALSFAGSSKLLASGSADKTVRVWDVAMGEDIRVLEGHAKAVNAVTFSYDGRTILSGSDDKTLRVWELAEGKEQTKLELGERVVAVAIAGDGHTIASASADGKTQLWDVGTPKTPGAPAPMTPALMIEGEVLGIAFSPDGKAIALSSGNAVRVHATAAKTELARIDTKAPSAIAFSSDGKTIAAATNEGATSLWNSALTECGADFISYIESGTKDVKRFFEDTKWLYADLADLKNAERTIDNQVAIRTGTVEDIEHQDKPNVAPPPSPTPKAPPAPGKIEKKSALGIDEYRDRWKEQAKKHDDFPTGYFETNVLDAAGKLEKNMMGLRIVSKTTGTGDAGGDTLLARIQKLVDDPKPTSFHPEMKVGLAGDIPNAVAEKDSIVGEAALASGIGFALILGGIVYFYRSAWSLIVISFPAILGVGCAYAFAMFQYGYVNTTGLFLGIIILGNGINYPIVLLSRYREFRARGQSPADARRDAVWNAFRAELVGACVGSIAYGSLTITQFRGFSQFGMIGFVGMLLVWLSMIPLVPALIVIIEWIQSKLPTWLRDPPPKIREDGTRGPIIRGIASATARWPVLFLAAAGVITVIASVKLPSYFQDPWEYNFDRLGSRGSKQGGAGEWSTKAEKVFGGKMNVAGALMLADSPEQVPLLKAQIFKNDEADPQGKLVAEIATVADFMPGTAEEQQEKLAVLDKIRSHITPRVLYEMPADEKERVEEVRPPEGLHALEAKDLPPLMRRRFEENDGKVGTVFYVKYYNFARKEDIRHSDGHTLLRMAKTTDRVQLDDANHTIVQTASRATIFAEMIRSMERDGPLATFLSFGAVMIVVLLATRNWRGGLAVLSVLVMGVVWTVGGAALLDSKLNFLNFIALPITFGIGCEYPFNVYDRSRLLGGDVTSAVKRVGGAVALCSYTTVIGYSSLLFADNQALQSFGQLAMSGEIACLAGALLVLPALLHVMARRSAIYAKDAPASSASAAAKGS